MSAYFYLNSDDLLNAWLVVLLIVTETENCIKPTKLHNIQR